MIKLSSTHFFCTHLVGTQCWKIYNSETLEVHFPTSNTFLRHVELLFLAYLKEKKSLCLLTCCLSFCSDMWKDNISIEKSSTKQTFWDSLGTFGMLWSISWTVGKSRKYRDDDSRCRWQVCNLHRIPNTILKRSKGVAFVNVDIMEMISTTTRREIIIILAPLSILTMTFLVQVSAYIKAVSLPWII